jgi:hypothetical protein
MGVAKAPVRMAAFVLATLLLTACALAPRTSRDQQLLETLKADLAYQYHECVPLGWAPVRVMNSYYPGYSASLQNYAEWLDAMWIGSVHDSQMQRPDVATVVNVLNRLVDRGLLTRKRSRNGYHYFMTLAASHYFYVYNLYRNNPDMVPYLCYSTVMPTRIVRTGPVHVERRGMRTRCFFSVTFEWKDSAPASWANDPYLRAHSVILSPTKSPTIGNIVYVNGDWDMASLDNRESTLPTLVDPSAWPGFKAALPSR